VLACRRILRGLVEAFRDAGGKLADEASDVDALEAVLASLHERGRAAHPTLDVAAPDFAAHLGRCGAVPTGGDRDVHAEDLFLACACLQRVPGAVERLQEAHRPSVLRQARRTSDGPEFLDEVVQRLWDALFVGGGAPRLATYSGTGPLERWLAVSAQRIAFMIVRHEGAEGRAREEIAARDDVAFADPEMAAIKQRYREPFQRAVEAAISALDPRDKMIYRMHLVEGLSMEQIGRAYQVHQSTISRWLAEARERVLDGARQRLRVELALPPAEFDSLMRLLVSQLDLNLSHALGKPA
jgi:RNA polymerase sigma-70 factor, ECF subfamily